MADYGISAQDGGAGIDNNIVFNIRMPFNAFDGIAVFIQGKTFSAKELHPDII